MAAVIARPASAQPQPQSSPTAPRCTDEMQPVFRNLDFGEGKPGERPPGWYPFDAACYDPPHDSYAVETVSSRACYSGRHCAVVKFVPRDSDEEELIRYIQLRKSQTVLWFLHQVVDVTAYRGNTLTFRAAVRAAVPVGSEARLMVRVHREDASTSFYDDMGKFPVRSSAWHIYEIRAPIAQEARDVEFGLQLVGQGEAWIDHISMEFTNSAK